MRNITRATLSLFLSTTMLSAPIFVSGCSWFKGSSGDSSGISDSDLAAARDARFGDGSIPTAEREGMFRDMFFSLDSSSVSDTARQDAEANASKLRSTGMKVQVEGHCDERGTQEYNLVLGAARARAIKNLLVSLGVSANKLEAISYGKDVPLDPEHNEQAWAKNRRVHLSAIP